MRLNVHLLIGFLCLAASSLNAQCTADVKYRDSLSGVYPQPYVETTRPNGGINKAACIGKSYSFVWTIKLGDTISFPNPLAPGTTVEAPIDSVLIAKTGAISGLPVGITYACNPPNCIWKKKTEGCVILTGTPTTANAIKTYPLVITAKAFAGGLVGLLFPTGYEGTLPGSFIDGKYDLAVYGSTDTRCTTAAEDLTEVSGMTATPNPTNGKTVIKIESSVSDKFAFSVTDLLGRQVISRPFSIQAGTNTFDLDVTGLPNGIYIYTLSKGNRVMSNKLIINQ